MRPREGYRIKSKYTGWYYISNYKFNSLFLKNFFIIFVAIYLPLTTICLGVYFYFQKSFLKEVTTSSQNTLLRIQEIVDTVQANAAIAGANLASEVSIEQFVTSDKWELPSYELYRNMLEVMKSITLSCGEYIESIYVYSDQNQYVLSNVSTSKITSFFDTAWMDNYLTNREKSTWWSWGRQAKNSFGKNTSYLTTAYTIPYNLSRENKGVVLFNLSGEWLTHFISNKNPELYEEFYIVDTSGQILFSLQGDQLGTPFSDTTGYSLGENESYIMETGVEKEKHLRSFASVVSEKSRWHYVSVSNLSGYQSNVMLLKNILLLALTLLLLLAILVSYKISARVFLPIQKIIQMIDNPKAFYDRNTEAKSGEQFQELRYITNSFLNSITKTEQAEKELVQYITKLKEAQVAMLQAQINPHFLYNTLQTINFLAFSLTRSDNEVSRAIGMLSTMFSQMMQVDSNTIPISDEIAYSKAYLDIERLRRGDDFDVVWEVEEEILQSPTVKFTLQPILENAIRHGFRKLSGSGEIHVAIRREGETILFSITDNGVGQDAAWIRQINEDLQEVTPLIGAHIGIRNVNQRIRLVFGNEYGVSFHANQAGGIQVQIRIPKTETAPLLS